MARAGRNKEAVRSRAAPRGTFALEPVEALPRYLEGLKRLAEHALEPNPFFLPEFLAPAMQALGPRGLRLAVFSDRQDVQFFAPVRVSGRGILGSPQLTVWTHPFAPLGAPLIDAESADQIADSLVSHLRESGRRVLRVPELPLAGPVAKVLRQAFESQGFVAAGGSENRPILHAGDAAGMAAFDKMVPPKRQRELARQLRRLSDTGAVSLMTMRSPSEMDTAFGIFAGLEGSGWKGRRGTALNRNRKINAFARTAILQMAQSGRVAIDILRAGEIPVAALIRFDHAGLSVPWKVAYDEQFANFSPGKQLMCDATRRWLADPTIQRVDPVCGEDNPLMAPLWSDREPYGTLVCSLSRWGVGPRIGARLITVRKEARRRLKKLMSNRGSR